MNFKPQKCRLSRTPAAMKEMISKLYFSRTKENYLKMYGKGSNYVVELIELMSKVSSKKLNRIVEEAKTSNPGFRNYLQSKKIVRLSGEDVVNFQNNIQNENKHCYSKSTKNIKTNKNIGLSVKQLDQNIIRIGFMMILQKLRNLDIDDLINQAQYIRENIERSDQNLRTLGFIYAGLSHKEQPTNIIQQLKMSQLKYGKYKLIPHKLREQSLTLHSVGTYLRNITIP